MRTKVFQIRMTEEEEAKMREGATHAGFPHVSEFLRHLVRQYAERNGIEEGR